MAFSHGAAFAWWYLSKKQKQALEEARKAGRFGGESAKAAGRAPYYWAQEHGEPKAAIIGQRLVEAAVRQWRMRSADIVKAFLEQ